MNLEAALINALSGMVGGPNCLESAVNFQLGRDPSKKTNISFEIQKHLRNDANDKIRLALANYLNNADFIERADWTKGTRKNTKERRDLILSKLNVSTKLAKIINEDIPVYSDTKEAIIEEIGNIHTDWYTKEFAATNNFYWKAVLKNLEEKRLRSPKGKSEILNTVASIDSITSSIINRLSNPRSKRAKRTKGLVVGYVQSGKTTNFISLVAKAIDSGYKIIIVFAGLTDLLRRQTQKRIDMDLIGVEQIGFSNKKTPAGSDHEYSSDSDWPDNFIQYGFRPSEIGRLNIDRITTTSNDFSYSSTGTNRLRIVKKNKRVPLFAEENLQHADAKVVVVKKENFRLSYLLKEIQDLSEQERDETPVLVIDDESDQASVNTKADVKERSKINSKITEIISLFKRAQYIGYTATPFANVFIDSSDDNDLFPSDFIFSLDRPPNYMGLKEFTDVEENEVGRSQNRICHVRDIQQNDEQQKLQEAIDSFLISGAIKCFREKKGNYKYKHHTMLFHESTSKDDHEIAAQNIREIWNNSNYNSAGCLSRLEKVFNNFRETWEIKGKRGNLEFPNNFETLKKTGLPESLGRIQNGDVALKVNSAEDSEAPDFSGSRGIWKVLIGGAKLSRGYTVEGLTVSFFQRNSNTQDTLMQMGRWFGYREGYEDLIRLYIARNVTDRRGNNHDLYEKFENLCRDEEEFRKRLSIYSRDKKITPKQVRVFVFNSHPHYKPTAKAKMRNAEIVSAYSDYREPTKQALNNKTDMFYNIKTFQKILKNHKFKKYVASSIIVPRDNGIQKLKGEFYIAIIDPKDLLLILNNVRWEGGQNQITPEIQYISDNSNKINRWLIVAPIVGQTREKEYEEFSVSNIKIPCIERTKASTKTRINAWNSPKDVIFAKWLVSQCDPQTVDCEGISPNRYQGVLLFWPVLIKESKNEKPRKDWPVVTGFAIAMPDGLSPWSSTVYAGRSAR